MVLRRRPRGPIVQKKVAGNKAFLWGRLTAGLSKLKVADQPKQMRFAEFLQQKGFRKSLGELQSEADALFLNLNDEAFKELPSYAISARGEAGFIIDARRFLSLLHEAEQRGIL